MRPQEILARDRSVRWPTVNSHIWYRYISAIVADMSHVNVPVSSLSRRETQILELVASGETTKEISSRLTIAQTTVKWHVSNVTLKLGARSRTEAVVIAVERGYIRTGQRPSD
jgi:DNA-binding NarL/FixJ family response regulator